MKKPSGQSLITLRKRAIVLRQERQKLLSELRAIEERTVTVVGQTDTKAIHSIKKIINEL